MADANATTEQSKESTVNLLAPDGSFEAVATLEENSQPDHPPRLVKIDKQPRQDGSPTPADHREVHVILSTGSGHRQAAHFYQQVVEPILRTLYGEQYGSIQQHTTTSETSILELTRDVLFPQANNGTPLRIILASGDGGVIDLVNGFLAQPSGSAYKSPEVVLLPLGTANALYHSINAGKVDAWGLHTLSSRTSKRLPVFTATFSPGARLLVDEARKEEELPKDSRGNGVLHGAVVCSWGMHASLVADSDTTEYRKFGIDRFKMAAKEALYPSDGTLPHVYRGKVSVLREGEWTALPEEEHLYVLSTLVSNLEKPFCISPASKSLDDSMHLVHFGPTSGDETMRIMGLAYQGGKHVEETAVRYEKIDGLRIEFGGREADGRWRRICVDGKIVRVDTEGWVEVRREERTALDIAVV